MNYDHKSAQIMVNLQAQAVALVVVNGIHGNGASVSMIDAVAHSPEMRLAIANGLTALAEQLRKEAQPTKIRLQ